MPQVADVLFPYLRGESVPDYANMTRQQLIQQAPLVGGMVAAPLEAGMTRMFHGTGSAFETPEPGRFAEEGLYGPGYYLTSDPRVAGGLGQAGVPISGVGGYAMERAGPMAGLENAYTALARSERTLADVTLPPDIRAATEANAQRMRDLIAYYEPQARAGPNVRAVDIPQSMNLLNMEAPLQNEAREALAGALERPGHQTLLDMLRERTIGARDATGQTAYDTLALRNKQFANEVLADAGFDGIQYEGGLRTPMRDAAGMPIQHTANVIFPES